MDFIKKNYEKVLLAVVLLLLTVGACMLPFYLGSKREELDRKRVSRLNTKVKELPPVDLSVYEAAAKRAQTPVRWQYTRDHNLVNPVLWQRSPAPESKLIKGQIKRQGPETLEVVEIRPLYFRMSYEGLSGSQYVLSFTNEAAVKAISQKGQHYAKRDEKWDLTLRDVQGAPEKPSALIFELPEGNQMVTLVPGKPYERIEAYECDLRYPPEKDKIFRKQRRDSSLQLAGEKYKIVAITASNVVVSAEQNNKKTTINYKP